MIFNTTNASKTQKLTTQAPEFHPELIQNITMLIYKSSVLQKQAVKMYHIHDIQECTKYYQNNHEKTMQKTFDILNS